MIEGSLTLAIRAAPVIDQVIRAARRIEDRLGDPALGASELRETA
ncbi:MULTISPECIES: hypothetical protein [unclassified Ensifer]|nr:MULTISPECIES: hypothetical protein [unclassified Ensifer]